MNYRLNEGSVTVIPSPRTASALEHTREWVRAAGSRCARSVREVTGCAWAAGAAYGSSTHADLARTDAD